MASREEIGALVVSATLDAQQFQNGVSNLKRQLAVTKSEFKAAAATLGSFGDDVDKLKLRSDSLSTQMSIQQKIVDTLTTAFRESAQSKGEDANATQTLAIKLNNAKATLATMADELKGVNLALDENAMGSLKAGESTERLGREERSFATSMKEAKEGIESTKLAMAGMMGIMAGGVIAEWTDGAEKMAINLQKLQQETGDSQDAIERLAVVASGAGISMDQLATMIGKMDRSVGSAAVPTKSFLDSLHKLGISAEEFTKSSLPEQAKLIQEGMEKSNLPAKELQKTLNGLGVDASTLGPDVSANLKVIRDSLEETANTSQTLSRALTVAGINFQTFANADTETKIKMLGKYWEETKDKAQATSLVMQVFGKQGADMLPLIQNFAELDEYARQLKMPVMDTHEIELAAEKTKMLQTAMQMLIDSAMAKLLPIVDNLGKAFYQLFTNFNVQGIKDFVNALGPIPALITGVITAFAGIKIVSAAVGTMKAFKDSVLLAGTALKKAALFTSLFGEAEGRTTIRTVASTVATNAKTAAMRIAAAAQAAFNAVMDANPIALVIIAIAALAVGIYELVKHWKTVQTALSAGWKWIKNEAVTIWNDIADFFKKWGLVLLTIVAPVLGLPILIIKHWSSIQAGTDRVWNGVKNSLASVWNGIRWVFSSVLSWLYDNTIGRFRGISSGIEGVMNGLHNRLDGIWSGIKNSMKSAINFMIRGINALIRALDNLNFTFPDWVPGLGGQSFGVYIPQIPYLATGAILTKPTLNIAGEAGPEAVIPLSGDAKMAPFAHAIAKELGALNGGSGDITVILQIDGRNFAQATAPHMSEALGRVRTVKLRTAGVTSLG